MSESTCCVNDDMSFLFTTTNQAGTVTVVGYARISAARIQQFQFTIDVAVGQSPKNLLGLVEAAGNQSAGIVAVANALGFPSYNLTQDENRALSQLIVNALIGLRPMAIAGRYNFFL